MAGFELLAPWHWAVLGLVLLVLEVIGFAGFMLGVAAAAFVTGFALWLNPELHWHWQLGIFSVLGVSLSVGYWHWFRNFNQRSDRPLLNNRAAQLIGQQYPLSTDINNGRGRIQVGDTLWQVHCDAELKAGDVVLVTGVEGLDLLVEASR